MKMNENTRKYVEERLDILERLLPENSCLELDYNGEKDVWEALYYKEDLESAFPIVAEGKAVVAFYGAAYENGISHEELNDILYDLDVYYVA